MTDGAVRPRVLVTRPSADALPLASELQRRGFDVLLQPLLRIDFVQGEPPDLGGVQALLFTSANGVRAFARRTDARTLPVYAVGDATAKAASDAGFAAVESAGGDVEALAALVRDRVSPGAGRLLHVAGSAVAGDLAGALEAAGYTVERLVLYSARQVETLDPAVHSALAAGAVEGALFFSPRSGASFVRLVRAAALSEACAGVRAFALSDAVAESLSSVDWHGLVVAPQPTQESLLATVERDLTDTSNPADPKPSDAATSETGDDLLAAGNAEAVVARFGGIRPMATKLGIPVTTVQGWRGRGHIPDNRVDEIRRAAAEHGVDLMPGDEKAPTDEPQPETSAVPASVSDKREESATEPETSAEPAVATAAPAETSASAGGPGVAWAALILAVVALAAVASYRYWGPAVGVATDTPDALIARVDALETEASAAKGMGTRLDQLDGKLATLSKEVAARPAATPGDAKALEGVTAEVDTLRSSIDSLSTAVARLQADLKSTAAAQKDATVSVQDAVSALKTTLADVESRLKAIETRPPATGEKIAAMAVSAGQLETAVDTGKPYTGPLASMRALAKDDAPIASALAKLDSGAATGVPTLAALSRDFADIAPGLMPAPAPEQAAGWTETLRNKALSLVNMRPIGEGGDSSPVTRAERALARDDLAAAVAAVGGLDGPAVAWREKAQRRLDADAALAEVRAQIVDRLATQAQASTVGRGTQ